MATDFLRYANRGATRNLPLSPKLETALSFLQDLGITAEVFSGGQPEKGSGGARVGSVRHDHGNAADVRFYQGGRQLDWANEQDRPLFEQIVQRGKAAGLTGFGAGPGYMSPGTMHVGFGSPGVWGAGGKASNAPEWLRAAYGGVPASPAREGATSAIASAMGASLPSNASAYAQPAGGPMASASNDPGPKQSRAIGGLGGLGGYVPPESDPWGDALSAIGAALIAGDGRVIPDILKQRSEGRERRADRNFERQWMMETFGLQRQDRAEDLARDDRRFGIQGERYAAEQAESRRRFEIEQANRLAAQNAPTADIREFEYARSNGFEGSFADWQRTARGQGGPPKASLSPVYGQDADGKAVLIQPRDDGTAVATKLPEGVSVSTGTEQIDAGTHWVLKDKRSGEVVGTVPKDNFGSARDTALGTGSGKGELEQFSGAGQSYRQADQMLSSIDGILKDPYLDWSTGMGGGVLSSIPGTPMRGVRAKIDQLGGQAFLQAFESLRGGGQITEVEGVKATQAIARLDTAQSPEDYRAALGELRSVVLSARERAERQAQSPPQTSQGAPIRAPMAVSGGNNDPLGLR